MDEQKTREQLLSELVAARCRIADLERSVNEPAATKELVEAANRLTNILNTTPDMVFVKDLELRTVLCNEVFARALGKTPAEMIGNTDIENGWDPELVRGNPDKGIRGFVTDDLKVLAGESVHNPCDPANVGNEVRYFDTYKIPLRDPQGRITGVLGISRDVTENRRAEDARNTALEQLTATLDALPDILFDVDGDGRIYDYHAPNAGLLAVSPALFLNRKVREVLPPDAADVIMQALAEAGRTGLHRGATYALVLGDEVRWYELSIAARKGATESKRFVALVRDVTERKRAEQALLDADRSKDEFLALLGHELRNPLAPIRNAVQVLARQKGLPERVQWAVDMIGRQSEQLERLVGDLLDVARIISGRVTLQLASVALRDALEVAIQAATPLLEARGQHLEVELPESPAVVMADVARLSQVFANLLHNAVKYTPEGGHIGVLVERDDDDIVVRIRDDGSGIRPEDLPRIFQTFFRAESDSTRIGEHDGLGLGLPLAKQLIERHGGSVSCHSDGPGRGAEFVVRLPHQQPEAMAFGTPPARAATAARSPRSRRILIVDDNPDVGESFKVLLEAFGHTARTVEVARDALALVREWQPDVVFLDIAMPEMDGYEVASVIHSADLRPRPLLVALTGYSKDADDTAASRALFDHYLLKPADPMQIETILDELP